MVKKLEGDNGNIRPGEGGGWGPGPKIPVCAMGENGKLGSGDGNWKSGDNSG